MGDFNRFLHFFAECVCLELGKWVEYILAFLDSREKGPPFMIVPKNPERFQENGLFVQVSA